MADFLTHWFQWFEEGISCLEQNEKDLFFRKCGRNCANTGVVTLYEKVYQDSGKDLDIFFIKLNDMDCIGGEVVKSGQIYDITFPRCLCDLHTSGYIHSDCICECSRHSILYVMKKLEPEHEFQVEKVSTVLGGDMECRFRITII